MCTLCWVLGVMCFITSQFQREVSASGNAKLDELMRLVKRMKEYQTELPEALLSQAVGMQGDTSRMENFIEKMLQGKRVKIALLGGSLSLRGANYGDEAFIHQVHKWLELTVVEGCREEVEKRRGDEASSAHVVNGGQGTDAFIDLHITTDPRYLATGHLCEHSHVEFINLAVPAAGPGYTERCVLQHLPEDVDMIIIDFGCNDYMESKYFSHPERHAYERILRAILSRPSRPAILNFEAFSWKQSTGIFYGSGTSGGILAQEKHNLITEYYGEVQVLSVRAALYQVLNATDNPQHLIYIWQEHAFSDFLHVAPLGHRWYADIIITYLRGQALGMTAKLIAAAYLKSAGLSGSLLMADTASIATPGTTIAGRTDGVLGQQGRGDRTCFVPGRRNTSYPVLCSKDTLNAGGPLSNKLALKPPFFPGNEVHPFGICSVGKQFESVALSPHTGWEWIDEGRLSKQAGGVGGAVVQSQGSSSVAGGISSIDSSLLSKWGFVSHQVDSELVLRIPVDRQALKVAQAALSIKTGSSMEGKVLAWLIYLQSYQGMGQAAVSCEGGCRCRAFHIDAHKAEKASVPALASFSLNITSPTPADCAVKVKVLPTSSSEGDGHKFKVIGITTSATSVWHLEEIFMRDTLPGMLRIQMSGPHFSNKATMNIIT
ncbi:hypothetical protein CEUSTIGMA_g928.t1 [Chlamydomonas eustigma]|uniref:SGNH hydrolase-type esterase domain-containing protein n=1 Tax=Chlamydomonas eustigma TaxID=1157962 RepID=A0A250WRZ5_9CHLO|nr:hypothetical protein CEUSTIGMA_g928.t1 [Chlamydomonas eustigma]|eukprot:GAX73476.1 hypothetical protein CEUSTIGMA_g928.t1 [Chlamydomonas eustigma]